MEDARPIFEFLANHLKDFIALEQNVHCLTEGMAALKGKRNDIEQAVIAAERQGLQRKEQVKTWLESVKTLEDAVRKIDAEFQTMFRCCGDYPLNVFSGCLLSRNAQQKLQEVRDLSSTGDFTVIADDVSPISTRELPSRISVGQEEMLSYLNSFVTGTEVGIVGIYGMGGVGKTTLLNQFNNDLRREAHDFELVLSIQVTEKVDAEKIQRTIMSRLRCGGKTTVEVPERADEILQVLSKIKFVIILDDVWERLDLSSLGIPTPRGPPYQSKIVVASRVEYVCMSMEAHRVIKVGCLGWDKAWNLFLEKAAARELVQTRPAIESYATAIVRKCEGLPLALTTIGLAMAAKKEDLEWRYAERALNNMPMEIPGMEKDVLLSLKRSYDNLPNDRLRLCFLYFILYQERSQIYVSDPVDYWIGEAIINEFDDVCEASVEGLDIIHRLSRANLLEVYGHNVRMHGMIHSMAKWVACECGKEQNKWLVQPGLKLSEAPELESWKTAERISLADNYISSISGSIPNCPNLISLMLNDNSLLQSFPAGFFQFMPSLRVLNLSNTCVEELPPEIGQLVELQFLRMSRTKLRLVSCELGKLSKLRYLDLSWNPHLKTFPEGVLRGLSVELRVFRMFETFGGWTTGSADPVVGTSGACFEELEGLRRLKFLMLTLETFEALRRLSGMNRLAFPTHLLHLRFLKETTTISLPTDLGSTLRKLKELSIADCSDLKEVIIDDSSWWSYLPQFKHLRFESLHNADITFKLGPFGCMKGLSTLEIHGCPKVEQLIGEVVETGSQDGTEARIAFPGLQVLYLIDLPELKSICRSTLILPSLRLLKVEKCPKLRRLPFGPQSCREMKNIHGRWEWWDELEWDDVATRDFFRQRFSLPPCNCRYIHR